MLGSRCLVDSVLVLRKEKQLMKLVAIILNYNTAELTLKAIDSALDALTQINGEWKLVVIDNLSTDDSAAKINEQIVSSKEATGGVWNQVEFIQSPVNGGFGAGNNIGFARYLGEDNEPEYFFILNSDAFPTRNAIKVLVENLDERPDCGIAGSYVFGIDDTPHSTAFRFPSIYSEIDSSVRLGLISRLLKNYTISLGIPEQSQKVDWLAGASMLIRSTVLKQVGVFDETFFLYFEETDLCRRARRSGWGTFYALESKVAHVGSASTGMKTKTRIPVYWLDSRKHYFQKNHGKLYFYTATLFRVLGEVAYRLRILIEGKEEQNPDFFIRDLIRHTVTNKLKVKVTEQ